MTHIKHQLNVEKEKHLSNLYKISTTNYPLPGTNKFFYPASRNCPAEPQKTMQIRAQTYAGDEMTKLIYDRLMNDAYATDW